MPDPFRASFWNTVTCFSFIAFSGRGCLQDLHPEAAEDPCNPRDRELVMYVGGLSSNPPLPTATDCMALDKPILISLPFRCQ